MIRIFIVSLLFVLFAQAGTYPRLFSQIGTPLYEADEALGTLSGLPLLEKQIAAYRNHAAKLLATGCDIESGRDVEMEELEHYIGALRVLQAEYDALVTTLRERLHKAIANDEHETVQTLSTGGIKTLLSQPTLKMLVGYYRKHQQTGRVDYLETMVNAFDKQPEAKESRVIVLGTSWCPACKSAKEKLRSEGIAFTEYDIERTATGKRLYNESNAHAIPVLIIGDEHSIGLDMEWVKERLK